jgi:hypothetical protein
MRAARPGQRTGRAARVSGADDRRSAKEEAASTQPGIRGAAPGLLDS